MTQHILIPLQRLGGTSSSSNNNNTTNTSSNMINATNNTPTIELKNVTSHNIDILKQLHLILFPVHYSDSFYQHVQQVGEFAKVVYVDDKAVGAICCRIEPELQQEGKYRVYIMTLGVLEAYRRRHLGHLLLQHVIDQAYRQPNITRIYLHVQVLNTTALALYHRHGFQKVALARDYYKHIPDKDAYVVVKNIVRSSSSSSTF
ncbi:acetyltransferase, GNAT family protein [Halteromyces radiatus]|uniref:acetyltransferase, GNAT family protein n=1 Tax=Halteromyces radiatus TaxID=101107 RepID=UPI00221FFE11|nr:acetyltransferase, GNAT family protein [Halteromyces radiatus]KAI8076842.1 acetyltransferase, GNAT family protein [Halteromyces radiatus]